MNNFLNNLVRTAVLMGLILGVLNVGLAPTIASTRLVPPMPPNPPSPPGAGAFTSGVYRNMFVERGYTPAEVQNKVDSVYAQLFGGSTTLYYTDGSNGNGALAYIKDAGCNPCYALTEGMSYAMMIAVQMNDQAKFKALWNWAKTYMYHSNPSHPDYGYFAWKVNVNHAIWDDNPAPDGEEYFAMALYFAARRWGSGTGIYNYEAEADALVNNMKNRGDITGQIWQDPSYKTITITKMFNPTEKQVRFTPDTSNFPVNSDHTDPSYHLPAFYELYSRWGPSADAQFWLDAAAESRQFFLDTTNDSTCLSPDYANFNGTPRVESFNANSGYYWADAWRTAMNWSVDYAWFAPTASEKTLSDCIQAFFQGQGLTSYGGHYNINGTNLGGASHTSGLVAMNATASLAATNSRAWSYLDDMFNMSPVVGSRYYDGLLYMLGLLHLSGNFRAYGGPIVTPTPTRTPTRTNTGGPTNTPTRTPTRTNTSAVTNTPTRTSPPGPTNTPTRTPTPTPTTGGGPTCSPVTDTITAPFVQEGVGAYCWQSTTLGGYINSWGMGSLTVNGSNYTNIWVATSSLPPKINGYWYVSYIAPTGYPYFEAK